VGGLHAPQRGELDDNPSPGNKVGGLTTILEKSLGAMAKAGTTNLVEVYRYAEKVTAKDFVFMDTPGYDPVSITGQVAGGANLVCFTTGRGSVYGCKPTPSIKLATNTSMYRRMEDDMDINCGTVLDSDLGAGRDDAARGGEGALRPLPLHPNPRYAATVRCRCSPKPAIQTRISWPGRRNTGSGFLPMPTPGGVPVEMMSPGISIMKRDT
jgi:hypothetical protein